MNQPRSDFFIAGVHHICRFCSTPIAKLQGGSLRPLNNKAHCTMLVQPETIHRFNCCKSCAKKLDASEEGLLQAIWESDCEAWKNLEVLEGVDQEEAENCAVIKKACKVVVGWVFKDLDGLSDARAIKEAKLKLSTLQ